MDIKLVVTDLDGTFLNSAGVPSSAALESVQKLYEHGIGFTLCSGRADPGTRPFVDLLKVKLPYIVSGGTAINDPANQATLYQSVLSSSQVNAVLKLGLESASDLVFHSSHSIMALCSDNFWENVCEGRWINKGGWKNVFRCDSPDDLERNQIIHINFFNRDDQLIHLAEQVESLPENLSTCIVFSKVEIIDRNASKGIALQYLANYLHIPMNTILAIGDGMNDISMLSLAGVAVAMKNSPQELIQQADFLAPTNDEDGFAWTINQLLAGTIA